MEKDERKNISDEEIKDEETTYTDTEDTTDADLTDAEEDPKDSADPDGSDDESEKYDLSSFAPEEESEAENNKNSKQKKRFSLKKLPLQLPIIIAASILVGALLGYFIFVGFFLKDPDGLWMLKDPELEGVVYYYNLDSNEKISTLTIGSVDTIGGYDKVHTDDAGNQVLINQMYGRLNGYLPYTITGTKLFGNQVLHITDGEYTYDLVHVSKLPELVQPVEGFTPNEKLLGTWEHLFEDYGVTYTFTFNADGTMLMNQYDTNYIHGTYSYDDEHITISYFNSTGPTDETIDYTFNGDKLEILKAEFTKVESK